MAADRDIWRHSFSKAVSEFEEDRRDTKGNSESPQTPHRTLLSPVDNAHGRAFPALDSSVVGVPADDVDRFPSLCSLDNFNTVTGKMQQQFIDFVHFHGFSSELLGHLSTLA